MREGGRERRGKEEHAEREELTISRLLEAPVEVPFDVVERRVTSDIEMILYCRGKWVETSQVSGGESTKENRDSHLHVLKSERIRDPREVVDVNVEIGKHEELLGESDTTVKREAVQSRLRRPQRRVVKSLRGKIVSRESSTHFLSFRFTTAHISSEPISSVYHLGSMVSSVGSLASTSISVSGSVERAGRESRVRFRWAPRSIDGEAEGC